MAAAEVWLLELCRCVPSQAGASWGRPSELMASLNLSLL